MAEVAGYGGSITFTNLTAGVKNWSINAAADMLDTTDFGSSGESEFIKGLTDWMATAEANWDAANTAREGDSATLTLTADTGKTYAGTALISSMDVGVAVDGLNTASYSFRGSGTLTITLA